MLLVSMLVRSSNEVDEDRFIHLGVVSVVVDEFEEGIRWLGKWPTRPVKFPENLSKLEVLTVNGFSQSTPSSLLASSWQA